ncbi:MAG: hypothetical protein MUO82_02885 [Candidatus Thermoplasmatota archaeon]|nr:hypothetical protein [Candidatus Thermoplasmatota archaeon]
MYKIYGVYYIKRVFRERTFSPAESEQRKYRTELVFEANTYNVTIHELSVTTLLGYKVGLSEWY